MAKYIESDGTGGFREVEAATVGGSASANKIPGLNANGRLVNTMLPEGVGTTDTASIVADEAIAAGNFVSIFDKEVTVDTVTSTVSRIKKADATNASAPAHGFVLEAVAATESGEVHFDGSNGSVTGMTPGKTVYLSTTAGAATHTAPTGTGNILQNLGKATSATNINYRDHTPITLA